MKAWSCAYKLVALAPSMVSFESLNTPNIVAVEKREKKNAYVRSAMKKVCLTSTRAERRGEDGSVVRGQETLPSLRALYIYFTYVKYIFFLHQYSAIACGRALLSSRTTTSRKGPTKRLSDMRKIQTASPTAQRNYPDHEMCHRQVCNLHSSPCSVLLRDCANDTGCGS